MRHVATVRPVPVPADGGLRGCLLCGVGTAPGYPHDAAELWGPILSANPGTLGGQNREAYRKMLNDPNHVPARARLG